MQGIPGPGRIGKQIGKAVNRRKGGRIATPGKAGAWGACRDGNCASGRTPGMTPQGRRLGRALVLAALLAGSGGCVRITYPLEMPPINLSYCHPVDFPHPDQMAPSAAIPQWCRNHVHIFLVHGMDPLDFANLEGLTEFCQNLGYVKTHFGQLYHIWKFKADLRKVREADREARFVLIGFSFGANVVRYLANVAKDEGIVIDLLVYLGGNTLENTLHDQPENVVHIVNILATGWIWNGCKMDRAENVNYDNCWHFGSPTHPKTLNLLSRELAVVAARVPVPPSLRPLPEGDELPPPRPLPPNELPPPRSLPDEELPRPRPALPPAEGKEQAKEDGDDWDFLEPNEGPPPPGPVQDYKHNHPSSLARTDPRLSQKKKK
jgi:pimeloyl-ACP methyl ester carboxylesterase